VGCGSRERAHYPPSAAAHAWRPAGWSAPGYSGGDASQLDAPLMERRILGRTGVSVSPLCLGAMMFGSWGNPDREESVRIIHAGLDAGINFIDTADIYSGGESEEIVGRALEGRRDDVVLATKFHAQMGPDANQRGNSRRWIMQEVENSLRRLRTDWIDLYQVHRPEAETDIEETLGALSSVASSASSASSLPTRCSCAGSRATCCPQPSVTGWA
jgi:hypothetical protein